MPGLIRRRGGRIALTAGISVVIGLGGFWRAAMRNSRATPDEPFRIAGNLYYVGAAGVTSFLLTGPAGDVLIDGGYPETAPAILASLARIGVDIHDVKILLNTHAHFDHAGGLRALQDASGAELWISERDAGIVASGGAHDPTPGPRRYLGFLGLGRFPSPRIDHRFNDGAIVRLGSIALTAHVTAGHTPGCTSWSFLVRDGNRDLLAVDVCSLTLLPSVSLVIRRRIQAFDRTSSAVSAPSETCRRTSSWARIRAGSTSARSGVRNSRRQTARTRSSIRRAIATTSTTPSGRSAMRSRSIRSRRALCPPAPAGLKPCGYVYVDPEYGRQKAANLSVRARLPLAEARGDSRQRQT
jgi:glyoxylase-like metal-dependent hydrolase (beta-lactamase superfamily II)